MKKRRSFIGRHSISVGILVIVAIFSVASTLSKQVLYDGLQKQGDTYLIQIDVLERTLKQYEEDLERVETLEFVEEYAREKLKMVSPDEIYFQIHYIGDDD